MRLADTPTNLIPQGWRVRVARGFSRLHGLRAAIGWQPAALLLFAALLFFGAYQIERPTTINVGGPHEFTFLQNWHPALVTDDSRDSYRWTDATSFVVLKGLGGGRERRVLLRLRSGRPPGVAQPVSVLVNGIEIGRLTAGPDWQMAQFEVRGTAAAARGLVIEVRTPVDRVPKMGATPVGVQVDRIRVETTDDGVTIPAWGTLGTLLLIALLLYLIASRIVSILPLEPARSRGAAAFAAGVAVFLLGWLFAEARAAVAATVGTLLLVLIGVYATLFLPPLLVRGGQRLGLAVSRPEATALGAVLALGVGLKIGGLLYPDIVVIDLAWHTRWERALLRGDFATLYFPSDLSSGPREWGAGVLIPKSPLYYLVMAPFAVLPFGVGPGLKLGIGLLEVAMPLFAYAFLKRIGQGTAGVVAAFLYAVTPLSYLALSWGIYPTLFAQFLTALAFAVVLFAGERLHRPATFAAFVGLLTLSLLAYPVVAGFNVSVLVGYGVWQWWRAPDAAAKRSALLLPLGAAIATVLSVVLYYIQYVQVMLASVRTIGGETATARGYTEGGLRGAPWHILTVVAKNIFVGNLAIPLVLTIAGAIISYRTSTSDDDRRIWRFLMAWLLVMPVFTLADAYIDLLLKPLYYTMLPVALFGGVAVVALWRRGRVGQVIAILCCLAITAQAWWLWYNRIAFAGQGTT